jgi:uncharacterized membrane protein
VTKGKHPAKQTPQIQASFSVEGFSGPLPPAEMMARYDAIIPNGADLMKMAEEQAAHRRLQEDRVIRANIRAQGMGVIFAFIMGMTGLGIGGYLIILDKDISGLTTMISSLGIILAAFLRARRGQERDRRERRGEG